MTIKDRESGIRVRLLKQWDVVKIDPSPFAATVTMCPECGEFFGGRGRALEEATREADAKFAEHVCDPAKIGVAPRTWRITEDKD